MSEDKLNVYRREMPNDPILQMLIKYITTEWGGWWSYSHCFVGCCLQDLFDIVHSILV